MKRLFKCDTCGEKFMKEADAFIPGIDGFYYNNRDEMIKIIDPTQPQTCDECGMKRLTEVMAKLLEEM